KGAPGVAGDAAVQRVAVARVQGDVVDGGEVEGSQGVAGQVDDVRVLRVDGDSAGIILLPVVQRTARVGDEALLPGAPRPAGVIVVDAGVLPAVARDFAAADLEGDHRVLVVAVD